MKFICLLYSVFGDVSALAIWTRAGLAVHLFLTLKFISCIHFHNNKSLVSFQKAMCWMHWRDEPKIECMPLNDQFIISIFPNWPKWINGKAFMDFKLTTLFHSNNCLYFILTSLLASYLHIFFLKPATFFAWRNVGYYQMFCHMT